MSEAYQVTPSVGVNIRSGPGTGYSKVGAYAQGTVVTVTATRDGWGQTEKGWVSLDYLEAVEAAQRVTDNGLRIQARYIDAGRKNRPGGVNPCGYITIHETGNAARGTDAAAHGSPEQRRRRGRSGKLALHGGRPRYCAASARRRDGLPRGDGPKGDRQRPEHWGRDLRQRGRRLCQGQRKRGLAGAAADGGSTVSHRSCGPAQSLERQGTVRTPSGTQAGPGRHSWRCAREGRAKTNRQTVQARFGLAEETMDYLEAYRYGADLLQKLAAAN